MDAKRALKGGKDFSNPDEKMIEEARKQGIDLMDPGKGQCVVILATP